LLRCEGSKLCSSEILYKGAWADCTQTKVVTVILPAAGVRNMIWLLAIGHQTGMDWGPADRQLPA